MTKCVYCAVRNSGSVESYGQLTRSVFSQSPPTQSALCHVRFSRRPPKINLHNIRPNQPSQRCQNFVVILPFKHKIQPRCLTSPLCCILQQSTSHHPTFVSYQCFTLLPAYLYQKDERTLPGNLDISSFSRSSSNN